MFERHLVLFVNLLLCRPVGGSIVVVIAVAVAWEEVREGVPSIRVAIVIREVAMETRVRAVIALIGRLILREAVWVLSVEVDLVVAVGE